jgi:processive 1,2-diacylglycerol beta-glucosyltransferase
MPRIDLSIPVFTVVTDSMEINAAWLRSPSNQWLVTDDTTRETMMGAGLDSHKLAVTGFQVHPKFAHMQTLGPDVDCSKFRILYFPTAKVAHMTKQAHALLDKVPSVYLTIVMGKNVRRLYRAAKKIKAAYPGRVRLIGWTTRIPEYFGTHHLAVGKAGGATVHEAIAARCPMLIPHLVPGQEEGNLRLLEAIGGGALADTPSELRRHLTEMLANNAASWREMKHAMAKGGRNSGALIAAYLILSRINQPKPKS